MRSKLYSWNIVLNILLLAIIPGFFLMGLFRSSGALGDWALLNSILVLFFAIPTLILVNCGLSILHLRIIKKNSLTEGKKAAIAGIVISLLVLIFHIWFYISAAAAFPT